MYVVKFTKQAAKDAQLKASGLDKKAKTLVELVRKDPFAKPPAYEALVGNYAGIFREESTCSIVSSTKCSRPRR